MSKSSNRRIIVGESHDGRSTVVADGHDLAQTEPLSGFLLQEIWCQDAVPGAGRDHGVRTGDIGIEPPRAGALIRILTVLPLESTQDWAPNLHDDDNRHVLALVSGDIDLILETGEVRMHAGDVVVISGHMHDWRNTYGAPAVLVYTTFPLRRN
jgi:hypothetical protein